MKYFYVSDAKIAIKITVVFFLAIGAIVFGINHYFETPSLQTQLELDIKMITPDTDQQPNADPNSWYRTSVYRYEDDKILIHSSFNNSRYGFRKIADDWEVWRSPYGRDAKFLGTYGEINVWLKPNKTLVYHSKINTNNQWRSPRSQDEFRSDITYRKGKWIKYVHQLADKQRKKFYHEGDAYKKREKAKKAKRDIEWKSESTIRKRKEAREYKAYKAKRDAAELAKKNRLKKATAPINDKDLFE